MAQLYPTNMPWDTPTSGAEEEPRQAVTNNLYPTNMPWDTEEPKQEGIFAHMVKGFKDLVDYSAISLEVGEHGITGESDEVDVAQVTARLKSIHDRAANTVVSESHKEFAKVFEKEGKDVDEAVGAAETALEILDMAGKGIWAAITHPQGFAEFTAAQLPMSLPGYAGGFAGWFAGSAVPIVGNIGGAMVGMGAGEVLVETGAAVGEALHRRGINTGDEAAVTDALLNTDILPEVYREGKIKAGNIALWGIGGVAAGMRIIAGPKLLLQKDLIKAGVTKLPLNKGGLAQALLAEQAGNKAAIAALKKYADATTVGKKWARRAAAGAVEIGTEGAGEGFGQKFAWGEVKAEEVGLEMMGALGQSVVQVGVTESLVGTNKLRKTAVRKLQARAVSEGKDSGIKPEDINEALAIQRDAIKARMVDIQSDMPAWEEVLAEADTNASVSELAEQILELEGIDNYRRVLHKALEDTLPEDTVPLYVALNEEEQATVAAGGRIGRAIRGSLNEAFVRAKSGETVVAVKVPITSIITRGNWDILELVSSPEGIAFAKVADVETAAKDTEAVQADVGAAIDAEVARLKRVDQDAELKIEEEAGFLAGQAEWSERRRKDYSVESKRKDKTGASKRAEAKRKQVRDAEEKGREYATEELDDVIARFNLKPRGNTVSAKREAIRTYRTALEKPRQTAAVNAALKGTGYKLQTVDGQIHLVPIDKRYDALSIPETGNKEVGQSTIDDYLSFIREDKGRKAPVSTAKERAALEREAEKVRARKKAPTEAQKEADQTRVEELEAEKKPTTTLKGRTTVVHTTKPGPLKSLLSAFKRKGQVKFHKQSQSLIEEKTKSGNIVDGLLKRIAGVYTKGRSGTVREQASRDPASILTLGPAADSNKIARAYALAVQYIFMRDSVSWIRPDNNLDIEASDTNLGIHVEFTRTLLTYDETRKRESNVRESQLLGQLRDIFGEDVSYTRLNDFEIILSSDKLSNINLARRLGRLRAKRDDIRKAELFTTKTETVSHNWSEDATGESIRSEIRELGFGDILAWTDDRRTSYLDLAEEFGATEVTQYRAPPRAPPAEGPVNRETAESLNLVSLPEGYVIKSKNRAFVLVEITRPNGETINVPFYISSGRGGKKATKIGQWYPIFGIGKEGGWLNKGTEEMLADYYGIESLRLAAEKLDSTLGDIRNDSQYKGMSENYDSSAQQLLRGSLEDAGITSYDLEEIEKGDIQGSIDRLRELLSTEATVEETAEHEIIIDDATELDEDVSYSLGEPRKPKTVRGWKLFVQRKDGTLGPLFINAKLRVPIGEWMPAESHPTKGFALRPQWHATRVPKAPHLKEGKVGSQFRVWREVELRGTTPMERPEAQGGTWFLANELRVLPTRGVNINDSTQPFTEQILAGEKTIETRDTDSLRPYVGRRVGIVRTGKGKATLVGYATVGEPIVYRSKAAFRRDESKHLVRRGSPLDIKDVKYGYPLTDVSETTQREVKSRGVVAREVPDEGVAFSFGDRKQKTKGEGKDTREKSERTLENLEKSIPENERVTRPSTGQRTPVTGGTYTALDLDQAGTGLGGITQADLNDIWDSAIEDTDNSTLARKIIDDLGMKPKDRKFWNNSLKLPNRVRYWYEVSAEGFKSFLRVSDDNIKRFIALVSASSPRADPIDSLRRGMGSFSQYLAGAPIDIDLTIPESVREAIEYGTLSGLKTGSFAGTMQYILGLEKSAPLSTNDRQVASSFGVTGDAIAQNPILYETLSRFYIKLRDRLNEQLPEGVEPFETWQLQALGWVEERADTGQRTREQTDDYLAALHSTEGGKYKGIIPRLKDAGVIKTDFITLEQAKNPLVAIAMSGTVEAYRAKQKFTLEVGSPFSETQLLAAQLAQIAFANDPVAAKAYLSTFTSVLFKASRGKTSPFSDLVNAILGKATSLSRLQTPPSTSPFDYAGTYDGVVSPNLRIPLPLEMSEDQKRVFLAVVGKAWKQAAVAHSRFGKEGQVKTNTVFIRTTEDLGRNQNLFTRFANELPDGHEVIIERWPNGYSLHITPRFDDSGGAHSITKRSLNKAIDNVLSEYDNQVVIGKFTGDYIENEDYDKIIADFRDSLTETIEAGKIKDGDQVDDGGRKRKVLEREAKRARGRLDNFDAAVRQAEELQTEFEDKQTKWVQQYEERLKKQTGAAPSLIPLDKPSSGGLSVAGLRRVLNKRFNKAGIAMLESMGILKIVASATDLPVGLITDEEAAMRARGLYYSKTGVAYLIANRLNATTAPKVLLHEVGTHFGLKRILGNDEYAKLIIDLEAESETTFKPWFDKVKANYRDAEGKLRIQVGTERFAEEVLAHIAEDTSDITLSLRQRIWRAVRLFFNTHFGIGKLPRLSAEEIGYVIQGSLRQAMRGRLAPYMVAKDDGIVMLGYRRPTGFPQHRKPIRKLRAEHFIYRIANAIGEALTPAQESRLRENMDAMMRLAEKVYERKYPNVDVDLPIVGTETAISSRYAHFQNTETGAELTLRVSDHPKDMFAAAGSFPFISFNNGQNIKNLDYSEIEKAVELLSRGQLDGMNGLEFQFDRAFGDGVHRVSKDMMGRRTYMEFLQALKIARRDDYERVRKIATTEAKSISDEEGPSFSIAPEDELTPEDAAAMRRTLGIKEQTSVAEWVNDARHRWLEKFVQGLVDAYRPIRNLGNSGVRAWQMMQLSENTGGMLTAVLNFGRPKEVYRNGKFDWYTVDIEGEGLIEVLKGLNGETNRFMAWMTYVRAKKLSEPTAEFPEGREHNFTADEIKAGINFNRGKMADGRSRKLVYAQTMIKMGKFQKSILDMAVKAGVLNKITRDELETDFYVPFYRNFTTDKKTGLRGPTPAHDFVNIKDVIHQLQGSEVDVHDVLHNVLMNWTAIMSASMKNRAGAAALEAAVKSGAARMLTDKKQIAQLSFAKGKARGDQFNKYVFVLKNGERVWYEVNDPLVLNSMVQLVWGGVDGKLLRVMSNFKRWLTIGVTASPYFKVRNLIRDTVHSLAVGKLSFNFFGNAAKGYSTLKNDDLITHQMLMGGGAFKFGFYHDDPQSIRMMLDAGIEESRILNTTAKIRKNLRPFWKWYADMGDRMENANRASLYMQRKEEVGHLQASFEARDLLNFSSHGRWVAVQWLTSMIPFLNARLQGLDKMARSGEAGSRARLLSVVGTVVLASILLRMSYEDDEDYNNLEEWQKNTYWPIKVPGSKDFFFLPKPFEIGAIASIGERITENFTRRMGTEAFGGPNQNTAWLSKYTWHQIGEIISDQLAVDWKPQIAKPVIEVWRNKNSFTNRYIENISWQMLNVPRSERVRAYSSEFAIRSSWAMGELLDLINAKDTDLHLSPVQVDHLIKGYFGWLGAVTTGAFDILDDGVDPQKRVGELFGSFYQRNPRGNSKHLTLFYDQMMEIAKLKSHLDSYKRAQKFEEARTLLAENIDVMRWTKSYERVRAQFGKISKRIGLIWDDKNMSPLEKEKEIDKLNQLKLDIATKTVTTRARIEAERGIMPSRSSIPRAAIGP